MCLQNIFKTCLQDVFSVTISRLPRRLQDVFKTSCKRSSRRFLDVFKSSLQDFFETCLQDVFTTCVQDVFKICLQDVLKTCVQDIFRTCLQDVFKTRLKRNNFLNFLLDVFKTSWSMWNCYAEDVLKTSSRPKNVCWDETYRIRLWLQLYKKVGCRWNKTERHEGENKEGVY